ncbi:hypothetical protein BKA70DRAFT_1115499 [Coprinopsis sp. MPI-PUGE-AT-0042]|nr:hypothetical protein BKA70DRAFT_1115499 [Coprinopsis sp. MPI-PUGE-AT-0042]
MNIIPGALNRVLGALKAANTDLLIKVFKLVTLASYTKNEVLLAQDATHPVNVAPACPPPSVILALQDLCGLDAHTVQLVWDSTKDLIWNLEGTLDDQAIHELFLEHGTAKGFPHQRSLFPPSHFCQTNDCPRHLIGQKLQIARQRQGVLYTMGLGPVPVYSVQLVCKGCNTTYHLDYCEKKNSVMKKQERRYYDEEPDIIQIGEHQFAETRLVQKWKYDMNLAHVSAGNCAASYKLSFLKESKLFPKSWQFGVTLSGAQVLDAFTLLSLLQHCQRIGTTLVLPHDGYQADRFTDAIHNRNEYIRQFGTPLLDHRCSKCVRIYPATAERDAIEVGAVIMDGITLGRPRCREYHCLGKLANSKMMFCNKHKDREGECAVEGCKTQADSGWKTCNIPLHRATDELRKKRVEGSHFPRKGQLERARAAHPKEGIRAAVEDQDDVDETLPEATVDDGRTKGEEQILATSCGIILGRDTMITAESMPACAEFVKRICGKRKCGMPQHLIYDNNCSFSKHVADDPVFAKTGLAVDVFHFDCKHSKTDEYCRQNCNPAHFPELRGENGKGWWFNTSICEQINAWLGGFHSMVREMYEDRYDFFLDEMIIMRNEATLAKLKSKGVIFF